MTDKTLSGAANPLFFGGPIVNGLFKWTDSTGAVKNDPVKLKADGPPIEVGLAGANDAVIGVVLEGGAAQNDMVVVLTKFTAVVAMTAGGTIARGVTVKIAASKEIVEAVLTEGAPNVSDITEGRVLGVALQSASDADIIYVGVGV